MTSVRRSMLGFSSPARFGAFGVLRVFALLLLLEGVAIASPIAHLSGKHIGILQQDYIDSYFTWDFQEINDTHWQASFTIDPDFWNDAKSCLKKGAGRFQCFEGFLNTYQLQKEVAESDMESTIARVDTARFVDDIANMRNYPLLNLTPNIRFSDFNIDLENGTASFYIIFPRGFREGERAKFGFGSTLIITYGTETEPFRASGRAICRTNNAIHVVMINGTTNVSYFRSTDNGLTWSVRKLDGSATGDDPVAASQISIACSGTRVFVIWNGGASGYDLQYMNSSDEGVTWCPYISNVAPKWFDGTSTTNLAGAYVSAAFGIGDNIWVAWVHDHSTATESLIVDNSTLYGGNLPTVTRWNGTTIDINPASSPDVIVNISGSTEEVYVPLFRAVDSDIEISYTLNGGATWSWVEITAGTFLAGQHSAVILNNVIYVVYATASAISIKNSTNSGATWSAAATVASETTSDPTIVTDGADTLWVFWNNGTASTNFNDVRYRMYNTSRGWGPITTLVELDSHVQTRPNAKFDRTGGRTELVFINRTASSGNIDLRYTYWLPRIIFTNPQNNNSNAKPNDVVNFSINVTTDYGYLSGYIFSNNFSGTWVNSSWVPVSGSVGSAIIWNNSYTATSPNVYGWKFFANITKQDMMNNSADQEFNFSTRRLLANWHTASLVNSTVCTSENPCQYTQYYNFTANATVECSTQPAGLGCGTVTGSIRYNASGATPNTLISTTPGATPFYTFSNPQSCGSLSDGTSCQVNWTVNASGAPPQTRSLDVNFTSSLTNDNPPTNDTADAYVRIPEAVVGFTITLPSQDPVYAAEGGNATAAIEFNLTGGNTASNVIPCLASTSTCQTDAIPIFQFTNTGTVNLNWYIYLSSSLPPSITLKGDTDSTPSGATTITTAGWLVASSITPTSSRNAWLWTDFVGASVNDATSRTLKSNATSS